MLGRRGISVIVVLAAVLAAGAGTARAAGPYVVGPGGAGATCSDAMPCTFQTAAGLVADGETILLKPGTSPIAVGGDQLNDGATVMPQIPGTRPELGSTTGDGLAMFDAQARLQDIRIEVTGLAGADRALDFQTAALAERIEVVAAAATTGEIAVQLRGGAVLRDSTVWSQSSNGTAVLSGVGGGTLRNVTALATGSSSFGLLGDAAYGVPQTTTVQNTILGGTTSIATTTAAAPNDVVINVDHSNFNTRSDNPPNAVINDLGGNQIGTPPSYQGIVVGNFHQAAGSPTIDAGVSTSLGPLDFDGGSRVVRATAVCDALPDIGADEFATAVAAPSFCTPASPTAAPPPTTKKKKCKKKRKRRGAGAAKKRCKKKKRR